MCQTRNFGLKDSFTPSVAVFDRLHSGISYQTYTALSAAFVACRDRLQIKYLIARRIIVGLISM